MKKSILLFAFVVAIATAYSKSSSTPGGVDGLKTDVPTEITGDSMYGNFSMTEYWNQNPADYLGNALEFAFAFTFNAGGTYTQYFTSSSVSNDITSYQQSVAQGTVEVDTATKTIITHPVKAHYKKTDNGHVTEERDLNRNELSGATYYYTTGIETSNTSALYLTLKGTNDPLTFLNMN
jgi:hypothetical protein